MADYGAVINRIFQTSYSGAQSSARVLSLEGRITGSTYPSTVGKTSTYSSEIMQVSQTSIDVSGIDLNSAEKNSASNAINAVRQQPFTGLQTANRFPSLGGVDNNATYILSAGDSTTNNGIVAVSQTSIDVSGIDLNPAEKNSAGNGINLVRQQPFVGLQTNSRFPSLDGIDNNITYALSVGDSTTNNGIVAVSQTSIDISGIDLNPAEKNSAGNGINLVRQQSFAGLQTTNRSPTLDGSAGSTVFLSNVNKFAPVDGIVAVPTTSLVGDDSTFVTNYNTFCANYVSNSLARGIKYYTMWGLDTGSVPRSWVVSNQPDMTGGQSGYNMATGSIRIINTWIT